jgi:hypothetical protein
MKEPQDGYKSLNSFFDIEDTTSKDDNVRTATGFVGATTKVDLAFRRSRAAAFAVLKSVCLGAICGISWSLRRPIFGFAFDSLRSAVARLKKA